MEEKKNLNTDDLEQAVGGYMTDGDGNRYYMDFGIDENWCICCGECEMNCPMGCISIRGGCAAIDSNVCIRCGYCQAFCPTDAIGDNRKIIVR